MSDPLRWSCTAEFYYSSCGAGRAKKRVWSGQAGAGTGGRLVGGSSEGTVSRRWKFSRRSFYRGLCGPAGEAIACCRRPSPPGETPAAPQDPRVPPPRPAACCCPTLRPTSWTPASGSAPCALCSAPAQKSQETSVWKKHPAVTLLLILNVQSFQGRRYTLCMHIYVHIQYLFFLIAFSFQIQNEKKRCKILQGTTTKKKS